MTHVWTALLVALSIGFETLCSGKDPHLKLKELGQPGWSPPFWAWAIIGLWQYAICIVGLIRLIPDYAGNTGPVRLLLLLMFANGGYNYPLFRMKRPDLAFYYLIAYWVLLAAFLFSVRNVDPTVFILFAIYAAYQVYAGAWNWAMVQLYREVR